MNSVFRVLVLFCLQSVFVLVGMEKDVIIANEMSKTTVPSLQGLAVKRLAQNSIDMQQEWSSYKEAVMLAVSNVFATQGKSLPENFFTPTTVLPTFCQWLNLIDYPKTRGNENFMNEIEEEYSGESIILLKDLLALDEMCLQDFKQGAISCEAYRGNVKRIAQKKETLEIKENKALQIPTRLYFCKQLQFLSWTEGELEVISPKINRFKQLATLDLSKNKIKILPRSLCELKNLKSIQISDNQIEVIPEEIGQLQQLTIFCAPNNAIKEIPASIGALQNLEILDLHGNKIKAVPSSMFNLKNLIRIDLENNQIENIQTEKDKLSLLERLANIRIEYIRRMDKLFLLVSQKRYLS